MGMGKSRPASSCNLACDGDLERACQMAERWLEQPCCFNHARRQLA
jgi:hypothetical protein